MEDIRIVELFFSKSERAISECKAKFENYLGSIAHGILKNYQDAEECVNDTYLKAWESIPPERPKKLSAYLGKITRNLAINRYNSNNAAKRGGGQAESVFEELEECIGGGFDPERRIESANLRDRLNDFLRGLSDDDRVIFVSRYWYFRSRIKLENKLKDEGYLI